MLLSHVAECGGLGDWSALADADCMEMSHNTSEDRATTQEWKEHVRGWRDESGKFIAPWAFVSGRKTCKLWVK